MKRFIVCGIIFAMVVARIAGAEEKKTFRVGYLPLLTQLPIVIAHDIGRLSYRTADFRLVRYTSFTSLEAGLRVGAIDMASIPVPMALMIATDANKYELCRIKILGAVHRGGAVLASKTGKRFEDLRGTLIGVPGLDSSENLVLKKVLETKGLRYGLDYKTIGIPLNTAIRNLKVDKLNALYAPEPYGSIAENEKIAFPVDGQKDLLSGILSTVLVVHSENLEKNRRAVNEWLDSVKDACLFIEKDLRESRGRQVAIIQQSYFDFPADIVENALASRRGDLNFRFFMPESQNLREIMRLASEMKLIMKSVDWDALTAVSKR